MPGHKGGESETIIGKWLKARGSRDKVVIATKVGMEMPGNGKGLSQGLHHGARSRTRCSACRPTTSTSTSRTPTTRRRRCEETLGAYEQLIKQGKVRAIGASNFDAAAAGRGPRRPAPPRSCRATRACSRTTTSYDRADFEKELRAAVPEGERRRDPLLRAGRAAS